MRCPEQANPQTEKADEHCQGQGGTGEWEWLLDEHELLFVVM